MQVLYTNLYDLANKWYAMSMHSTQISIYFAAMLSIILFLCSDA